MICGIHRVEKRNRQAIGGLQAEANRDAEHKKNFAGSDIDWSRTQENIRLISSDNWLRDIKDTIANAGIERVRKDAIMMLDGMYTASPDFFKNKSRDEQIQYFKDCLEFHVNSYCHGDESLVKNAVIHFDETTPHMQVCSVPITEDGRLSAKDVMGNKAKYHQRQDDFYEKVTRQYGLDRGEIQDHDQQKKHRDQMQYKAEKAGQTVELYDKQIERSKETLSDVQNRIKLGHEEEKAINSRIKLKNEKLDEIDGRIVDAKNLKKERAGTTIFGKEKDEITIPYEEYRTLYKTAKKANDIESREKDILHQKELLKAALEKANKIDYYLQVESARIAKEAVEKELENKKRDYDLERYLSKSESGKRILEQYKNQYKNTVNDTIVRAKQIAKNEAAKHDRDFEI